MTFWKRIDGWLRPSPWRVVGLEKEADEVPVHIEQHGIYLVASDGRLKWAVFDCPCMRGHRIMLNLDRARKPTWTLVMRRSEATLFPSVDIQSEVGRCHFFVRDGRIEWARGDR